MTAVNESSVRFTLDGNLRDNVFNCKLSIDGQTGTVGMTIIGMNNKTQDFTGLKPNHRYNITCTQVGDARTIRETSTCFRTQKTGTFGSAIINNRQNITLYRLHQPHTM